MRRASNGLFIALCVTAGLGSAALPGSAGRAYDPAPLRVCAEPDNMPFSNAEGQGFENKVAELVTSELGKPLAYSWSAPQPDRDVLVNGRCDVVIGVPSEVNWADTTEPYYWSSYVFISRADRKLDMTSLKDRRLGELTIGVASLRGNHLYTPPARILAEMGRGANLTGYPIDDEGRTEQRAHIIDAVARGEIDIAALWGPSAGYFVQQSPIPLRLTLIGDTDEFSSRKTHFELLGLQYEIAMGVRKGSDTLRQALDHTIARKQREIDTLLKRFGVPLIEPARISALTTPSGQHSD